MVSATRRFAEDVARHLCLVAWVGTLLAFDSFFISAQETEPFTHTQSPVHHSVRAHTTPGWPLATLMAIALTWALLEVAQLVLLLITDQDAVRLCYQQHFSAAQIKDPRFRSQMKLAGITTRRGENSGEKSADTEQQAHKGAEAQARGNTSGQPCVACGQSSSAIAQDELFSPPRAEKVIEQTQPVHRDDISTNIAITPEQLSDDSDVNEAKPKCRGTSHAENTSADTSICACAEEDYLVALEDDHRRPCSVAKSFEPSETSPPRSPKAAVAHKDGKMERGRDTELHAAIPADASVAAKSGASAPRLETVQKEEEAEHHFQHELLPSAEETLMDVL